VLIARGHSLGQLFEMPLAKLVTDDPCQPSELPESCGESLPLFRWPENGPIADRYQSSLEPNVFLVAHVGAELWKSLKRNSTVGCTPLTVDAKRM